MPPGKRAERSSKRQSSVFGEIIDWTLAPLLILWPISMAIQYAFAYSIANSAYDRELRNSLVALAEQVTYEGGRVSAHLPRSTAAVLRADEVDRIFYQVRGLANEVVTGDKLLPAVEFQPEMEPQKVYFRDEAVPGFQLRIAYMFAQVPGLTGAVLVQIGETDQKRAQLASDIIGDVLAAQFLIVPVALLFVWLGLTKGVEPLAELTEAIRRRKPNDMRPIDEEDAPEEVRPLIRSFNDLMARLDSSLKAQQRFVADAAHQMRTPLAGLKTQAELAMRQRDLESIKHAMGQIAASADRASHLISQLLMLARAESDAPPQFARLDLDVLAREVTRSWVPAAREKDIDLGFETAGRPVWVEAHQLLLQELVANLVDNAIRYTPSGGRVTVRVATAGERALLEVEDNGIGIEEAERDLVFERFYRVLGTGAEGSGLGLPIVKGIAELHRGSVRLLHNPYERGTIVQAELPLAAAAVQTLRPAA